MRVTSRADGYRRTIAVSAAAAVIAVVALVSAPTSRAGQEAGPAFNNGTAKATAILTRVAPGVGSLELAITNGVAVSEVTNALAQAQAQTTDLGLIGTSLTSNACGDPKFTPDQLPQPVRVDNRKGDAQQTRDEVPVAGDTMGGGRMHAAATKQPFARAVATGGAATFGPVVTLGGGRAEAASEVEPGVARQARAVVEGDLDIAGVVQLAGLRWEAVHRTGQGALSEGTFLVGSAAANGLPLPADSLEPLEAAVNAALVPSGITVDFPRVERLTEPTELVRVTPLRIVLQDSPVGQTVLGPGLNLTREQREALFNQLVAIYCDFGDVLLVGDIGLSVAAGSGFLAVEIGGVEARSADLVLGNPFGNVPPNVAAPATPAPVADAPVVDAPSAPAATPSAPAASDEVAAPVAPAPAATTVSDAGPLEELCESIHPFKWPSCSHGAAAPLGLAGLAATAGMAALDWTYQRRRLRSMPRAAA